MTAMIGPESRRTACPPTSSSMQVMHWMRIDLKMASALQDLPFVQQLGPRTATASHRLQSLLAEGLAAALHQDDPSPRLHCLQALATTGDAAVAEQVLPSSSSLPSPPGSLRPAMHQRIGQHVLGPLLSIVQYCTANFSAMEGAATADRLEKYSASSRARSPRV